ncbi:transposase [Flavobacteriaceae bacterium LMO-SS05]
MKSRKRNRMLGFDYSSDCLYFVTIGVKDRVCCFGEIIEGTARELSVHYPHENIPKESISNPSPVNNNNFKPDDLNHIMKLNVLGFDYSSDCLYFVTICVKDRICCFGEIIEGTVRELSVHYPHENISKESISNPFPVKNNNFKPDDLNHIMKLNVLGLIVQERLLWLSHQYNYVEIHNFVIMPNHVHAIIGLNSLKLLDQAIKIKSLSSLIGAFKTTSSKLIHEAGFLDFSWQRSFHDRIVRNNLAYQKIMNYIDLNPKKWYADSFFAKA